MILLRRNLLNNINPGTLLLALLKRQFESGLNLLLLSLILLLIPDQLHAQTDIFVRGSGKLYPMALPALCIRGGASDLGSRVPDVMARDLDISGFFEVLNPGIFIEKPGKCDSDGEFAYSDWSIIGAEGLVRGVIDADGSDIKLQLFLHDVQQRKVVLGKEYSGHISQLSAMAHKFANEIMLYFTGTRGVFGSQIAYSSRVGRFKELFLMDMSGTEVRQLTNEQGLAISASFSADGNKLVYTSYRNRVPDLFEYQLDSRRTRRVTHSSDLELGARYAPDARSILTSISVGKYSEIVLMSLDGKVQKVLSRAPGVIDVSPEWSPDYQQIVFCSNRSGGPQIYVMNADGSNPRRVSFVRSNYCTSPSWSPRGDRLAFVCRADSGFQLFAANSDGSAALQLTSSGSNEDPSWSPDGRYIAFSTTAGGGSVFQIALMREDGSNLKQLSSARTSSMEPAWGPYPSF